jgi:flagellar protein FliS
MYTKQLQTEVLTSDPLKLVCMLYRAAIEAVAAARRHLQAGAIRERSRQITKIMEILAELTRSLDMQQGGEISRSLADLYTYMQGRLMAANVKQIDAPLAEVERLLGTLLEAWSALPAATTSALANHASAGDSEYVPMSYTG